MDKKDDGGAAFPIPPTCETSKGLSHATEGMSLRDYFAAHAMQGLLAGDTSTYGVPEQIAQDAWLMADEMLKRR